MRSSQSPHPPSIPAEEYTREYFETCCEGYEEFKSSHGEKLPLRLAIPLQLTEIKPGMNVVDVGCGRGEMVINCALRGAKTWGIDFSPAALRLAHEAMGDKKYEPDRHLMAIQQSNAFKLPFADESIDLVYMLDIVEHLLPAELDAALNEAWRILRPPGRLIVHTMPNLWYYRFGYPLFRMVQRARGKHLPNDPRKRWQFAHVHVNEQDPQKLRTTMRISKFTTRIWLYPTQSYQEENNPFVRNGMRFLSHTYPFRWIFCNDIFAVGIKKCT